MEHASPPQRPIQHYRSLCVMSYPGRREAHCSLLMTSGSAPRNTQATKTAVQGTRRFGQSYDWRR